MTLHWVTLCVVALHWGALHPVEQVLVFLVAFGPILALFWVLSRRRAKND